MEITTVPLLQRITCAIFGIVGTTLILGLAVQTGLRHQWATLRPDAWPLLAGLGGGLLFLYIGLAGRLPPFLDAMRQKNAARLEKLQDHDPEFPYKFDAPPLPRAERLQAGALGLLCAALSALCWHVLALR